MQFHLMLIFSQILTDVAVNTWLWVVKDHQRSPNFYQVLIFNNDINKN